MKAIIRLLLEFVFITPPLGLLFLRFYILHFSKHKPTPLRPTNALPKSSTKTNLLHNNQSVVSFQSKVSLTTPSLVLSDEESEFNESKGYSLRPLNTSLSSYSVNESKFYSNFTTMPLTPHTPSTPWTPHTPASSSSELLQDPSQHGQNKPKKSSCNRMLDVWAMIGDIAAGVIIFVILGALVGEIWFTTKMMVLEKINEGKGEVINTGDLMYANEAEEKWLLVVFYQFQMFHLVGFTTIMWCAKLVLLAMYINIAEAIQSKWRPALIGSAWLTFTTWITLVIAELVWCWPLSSTWDLDTAASCTPSRDINYHILYFAFHIGTDIAILVLSLTLIRSLTLSTKSQKAVVIFLGILGVLTVGVQIASFPIRYRFAEVESEGGTTEGREVIYLSSMLEMMLSICVCCGPTIRGWISRRRRSRMAARN